MTNPTITRDAAQFAYLRWLSGAAPTVYQRAVAKVNANDDGSLSDLGWIQAVVQLVAAAGSAVMAKKQQDKQIKAQKQAQKLADAETVRVENELRETLVKVNTARVQKGLPPIDANGNIIPGSDLPTPNNLQNFVGAPILGGMNPMYLVLGAAGLLGVALLVRR
jgi:hypothetical protein